MWSGLSPDITKYPSRWGRGRQNSPNWEPLKSGNTVHVTLRFPLPGRVALGCFYREVLKLLCQPWRHITHISLLERTYWQGAPAATTFTLRPCPPLSWELRTQHDRDIGAGPFVLHMEALRWAHDLAARECEALPSSTPLSSPRCQNCIMISGSHNLHPLLLPSVFPEKYPQ